MSEPTTDELLDALIHRVRWGKDENNARAAVAVRMSPGWQPIETAPDEGRVWVRGGHFDSPRIVEADGKWWRHDLASGRTAPSHWAPCNPPPSQDS